MRLGASILCVLTACAPDARGAARPLAIDDAAVVARSHAFFEAWDRGDATEFDAATSPVFETFSHERFVSKPMAAELLRQRTEHRAPPRTRTWKTETVIVTTTTAVFVGEAVEHLPADGDRPARDQDGWHTLVWASDRGAWKVVHYQWQSHDTP